jgi:hypothetical protein
MKGWCLHRGRMIAFLIAASAVLSISNLAAARSQQRIYVQEGFLNGSSYLDDPDGGRMDYVMGLMDGLFLSPLFGASENAMQEIKDCLSGMNNVQLRAMLDKHIRDHPEQWHYPSGVLFYQVLLQTCPQIKDQGGAQQ